MSLEKVPFTGEFAFLVRGSLCSIGIAGGMPSNRETATDERFRHFRDSSTSRGDTAAWLVQRMDRPIERGLLSPNRGPTPVLRFFGFGRCGDTRLAGARAWCLAFLGRRPFGDGGWHRLRFQTLGSCGLGAEK